VVRGRLRLVAGAAQAALLAPVLAPTAASAQAGAPPSSAAAPAAPGTEAAETASPQRSGGLVIITGQRLGTLPTTLPTTVEGIGGAEIQVRINATDSEDALKYLPSLLVRKRYIGDYNHAVLSSRASGTGNSARSMVYADGILLSNYLGNGAGFTPRWGLVTPEEIERVDVLYGPFSAAYPGNSVGAVVDYVTRMPRRFEAHVKLGGYVQPFELYNTKDTYTGWQASASLGDRLSVGSGGFAWWVNVNRLDSQGQPLTFATKAATTAAVGTPVVGAVAGVDRFNTPWWIIGAATQYHTVQDHAKAKLAWDDGTGALRLAYTLGWWNNRAVGQSQSYLTRTSDGSPFFSGVAAFGGSNYTVAATDFNQTRDALTHWMHGFTAGGRVNEAFGWDFSASLYDYGEDKSRTPTIAKPAADTGGAGRITDLKDTGWHTLALKGRWKASAEHGLEFGVQHDRYQWRQRVDNAADWIGGAATTPVNNFEGNTSLTSVYGQDTWALPGELKAVLGLRVEQWQAFNGLRSTGTAAPVLFQERREHWVSPKAALGWQVREDWSLKVSTGRAVRAPTVGELFQGNAGTDPVTNPGLKPEKSWTSELSSEWSFGGSRRLRTTLFREGTTDALYSQAIAGTVPIVNSVQNIDRIRTWGLENAFEADDLFVKGLGLQASLTYADSKIVANSSYVSVPGDTVGKQQPRVPKWRASALATWRVQEGLSASYGLRYGSTQYGTLNNSDVNGFAYLAFSKYYTTDLRLHWKIDRQWSAAFGIDNLNNYQYWNFHPYPQRTYSAEVRFDL
jgi:iron complex outermembrane receptor protein